MALIWITGSPGTGKTAVVKALKAQGFEAFDADHDGFRVWRRRDTGEKVGFPGWPVPIGWHEAHYMPIERSRVEALSSKSGLIFLSGSVENENEVWDLFTAVVCLVLGNAALRRRLAARPDAYGKAPDELVSILRQNRTCEATYRDFGAAIIDARQPLKAVVKDVLQVAAQHMF